MFKQRSRGQSRRAQLTQVEQAIAASKTTTLEQLTLLKTYDHNTILDLYYRLYNTFVADKELDERDIATLGDVQQGGGLTNQEVRYEELIRPYYYVSAIRTEGKLPTINLTVEGAGPVILRKGEVVHYAHEATLNEIKRVSLGYSGGSHGVSIPLPFKIGGSPIRYRVGHARTRRKRRPADPDVGRRVRCYQPAHRAVARAGQQAGEHSAYKGAQL